MPKPIPNTISQYDLATAYNQAFGTKYATGDNPSFKLSFSAGEGATGSDPSAIEFHCGDKVKLPDCPYAAENMTFAGWSVGGAPAALPAGSEYPAASYEDFVAEAT